MPIRDFGWCLCVFSAYPGLMKHGRGLLCYGLHLWSFWQALTWVGIGRTLSPIWGSRVKRRARTIPMMLDQLNKVGWQAPWLDLVHVSNTCPVGLTHPATSTLRSCLWLALTITLNQVVHPMSAGGGRQLGAPSPLIYYPVLFTVQS